ncbi:hypothetical protein Q8A67_009069 [Cirrhinus molitorella]|uniref:Uncharacterized protein n=1 Tax=Cirrhinus molitorella TaxID=172907 RepID=A0AA88PRK1_9TELE|nr:hypothetical protein Q8A67_009069 [Cirrhinus molitorella]
MQNHFTTCPLHPDLPPSFFFSSFGSGGEGALPKFNRLYLDIVLPMSVEYGTEKTDLHLRLARTRMKGICYSILLRFVIILYWGFLRAIRTRPIVRRRTSKRSHGAQEPVRQLGERLCFWAGHGPSPPITAVLHGHKLAASDRGLKIQQH